VARLYAGPPQNDGKFTEHLALFQMKHRNPVTEVILLTRPIQGQFYECPKTSCHNAPGFGEA
jgi:hypothetical protein